MRIQQQFNNKKMETIKLKWQYGTSWNEILIENETICEVTIISENGDTMVGCGWSWRNEKDTFCKEIARKHSLRRALDGFTKEQRTMVWNSYFSRKKLKW